MRAGSKNHPRRAFLAGLPASMVVVDVKEGFPRIELLMGSILKVIPRPAVQVRTSLELGTSAAIADITITHDTILEIYYV